MGEIEEAEWSEEAMTEGDRGLARRIAKADRELAQDDRFQEEEEALEEGEVEITLGEWIPGSRRPKPEE
jgi:hypothetical protein